MAAEGVSPLSAKWLDGAALSGRILMTV